MMSYVKRRATAEALFLAPMTQMFIESMEKIYTEIMPLSAINGRGYINFS